MTNQKPTANQKEKDSYEDPFESEAPVSAKVAVIGETCTSCEG